MARRKLFVANWKLNHNQKSAAEFVARVREGLLSPIAIDMAVAPVAPMLQYMSQLLGDSAIKLAAQNVYFAEKGAFTGEWSVEHLQEVLVDYCIVGHSERRAMFGETDEMVGKKARACFLGNLTPIICVGETLDERESGMTEKIIERHINAVIDGLEGVKKMPLIIAYEPVWAIGTGKTASPEQAEDVHRFIRQLLAKTWGHGLAEESRILYGGSVNAGNIGELALQNNVDGALVGGASLQADSFLSMVKTLHGARS